MDAILAQRVARGDFTQAQLDALNDAYFYAYCTEADFRLIRDTGLNTIRLPVYYRNFMEGSDENLTMRPDAFEKLDYFLELAQKYDLKVIVDMHGVVGGQSGFEHCGTRDMDFWENETYIASMCELWQNIASHYVNQRPDLAPTILAYDLVNEPVKRTEGSTTTTADKTTFSSIVHTLTTTEHEYRAKCNTENLHHFCFHNCLV
jgi:aryl-phospho-beta-D-glucosidase BglC (GH1 family)